MARSGPRSLVCVIDSLVAGGAERSLLDLVPHLTAHMDLTVACLSTAPGLREGFELAGAEVVQCDAPSRWSRVRWVRSILAERRPDLVHTTLFEADVAGRVAARWAGVPVVSSLVNDAYGPMQRRSEGVSPIRLGAARVVDAVTARATSRLHAVSGTVADTMAERIWYPRERIDVVHRGRDGDKLGRRTAERRQAVRRSLGKDGVLVLLVGRQEPQKGYDTAIRACARLRSHEVQALVAGREGRATGALRRLVADLELGQLVTFLGARDDVPDLLAAADVAVFPSRWEGMPGAVLEAMALEVPIVASDIPAHREVLGTPPSGVLVPVDDDRSLAEAIIHAARGDASNVAAARRRFEQYFTIATSADGMLAFYERALRL